LSNHLLCEKFLEILHNNEQPWLMNLHSSNFFMGFVHYTWFMIEVQHN